jgi:hypothetical protein
LVRVRVHALPLSPKDMVYAPVERADTRPLFLLYYYMYFVDWFFTSKIYCVY